jgi:hypothetical protein
MSEGQQEPLVGIFCSLGDKAATFLIDQKRSMHAKIDLDALLKRVLGRTGRARNDLESAQLAHPRFAAPLKNPRAWETNGPSRYAGHVRLTQRSRIIPIYAHPNQSERVSSWP